MAKKTSLIVVANRLPVRRVKQGGRSRWETSPGGLVSALLPFLKERRGTWVGWSGQAGAAPAPFEHEEIRNVPVRISASEIEDFYEGFCNSTLWPLYHDAVRAPVFRRRWWWPYIDVNRRYAEVTAEHAPKNATVWVQDYQLQLVPGILRELRPDLHIGFFLHIPFPAQELYAQLPWRRQIIEGILGSDVVGFQTKGGAQNFIRLSRRYAGAQSSRQIISYKDRKVRAQAFPISIDFQKYEAIAGDPATKNEVERIKDRLGSHRKIILGADRLDYTKGIDRRLRAFNELLEQGRAGIDDCVMVQIASPSRERVDEYIELRRQVAELVGHINGQFGEVGRPAVHYINRNLTQQEMVAMYVASDVMLVTPYRDGMNLIAKEYIAARTDETGVLILSEFAGAAQELSQSLLVNPHDLDGLALTLSQSLDMPISEQKRRMHALRRVVRSNDVYDWAKSFLNALAA